MNATEEARRAHTFYPHELVTWHYSNGKSSIPVPGVVVRQEAEQVLIRARVEDAFKELQVHCEQLTIR